MRLEDLLDQKLGDILDNYVILSNHECGYEYGLCESDLVEKLFEEYDVDSYKEAFTPEPLISFDLLTGEMVDEEKAKRILKSLGINRYI